MDWIEIAVIGCFVYTGLLLIFGEGKDDGKMARKHRGRRDS